MLAAEFAGTETCVIEGLLVHAFASTVREHRLRHDLVAAIEVVREHELQRRWKRQWLSASETIGA